MWLYWRTNAGEVRGFLLGVFFTTLFTARFFIEYIKEGQGGTDDLDFVQTYGMNVGQALSLPLVLFGLFLVFRKIEDVKLGKKEAAAKTSD